MLYRIFFLGRLILIFILILTPKENLAQEAKNHQPLTLEDGIQIALKNSLKLQSALKEIASLEANIKKAWAKWLPHLYLNIDSGYNKTEFSPYQKSVEDVPSWIPQDYREVYKNIFYAEDSKKYTNNINIGLTQWLLDNGQISTNISIAQIQYLIAKINLESIKKQLVYQVSRNYYELLKYRKMIELNQKLLNIKEEQLKKYESKLDAGIITTSLLLNKKLEVLTAKNDLMKIEDIYERKREEFLQLLDVDTLPEFDFNIIPDYIPYEGQLKEAISKALEDNLQIQVQQLEIRLKEKEINLARSGRKVSAMITGNYGYDRSDENLKKSLDDFNKEWNVRINITLPFFTGGEVTSDIKASLNKYSAAQLTLEALKKEITSITRQKYLKIKNLERQIELLQESEKIACQDLIIAQTQYDAKIIAEEDLCDKQITLDKIILEKIETLFDHQIAKIEFFEISGPEEK
ncbi:MAG: TolC family protein [bacterium]